jgi:thiol-disulfide isomerase/thioredoxin
MKKNTIGLWIALFAPLFVQAQSPAPMPAGKNITLTCKILSMPTNADSLFLYEGSGMALKKVGRAGFAPDSTFVFSVPASQPKYYGIGLSEMAVGRVLLGTEPTVTVWANAQYVEKARAVNSAINKQYEQVIRRCTEFTEKEAALQSEYKQASNPNNPPLQRQVTERAQTLSRSKKQFLDSLQRANPMLWRTATLSTQPEYLADNNKKHANIVDFYGKESFNYVKWTDLGYAEQPHVSTAFEQFTQQLLALGATEAQLRQYLTEQIAKIPAGSYTHRMALGGTVQTLKTLNNPLYTDFAKQYIDAYRANSYGEIGRLEFDMNKNVTFTPGGAAPELSGATPEGGTFALSQLRGKYVLIDFWASWCGPCRKENPNVVANYNKYKSKGFEILGVSLDKNAEAWKKAIADDGLTWKHISDLKGWSSDHARLYSVSSIPQTLLLDKEGKIIQRNLRGEQLAAKLKEIFGE